MLVLPAAVERIALQHLEEQMRASTRRVCLFARRPVAWAHRSALMAPAFAHTDTADRREGKAAMILREDEMRGRLSRMVIGAEP